MTCKMARNGSHILFPIRSTVSIFSSERSLMSFVLARLAVGWKFLSGRRHNNNMCVLLIDGLIRDRQNFIHEWGDRWELPLGIVIVKRRRGDRAWCRPVSSAQQSYSASLLYVEWLPRKRCSWQNGVRGERDTTRQDRKQRHLPPSSSHQHQTKWHTCTMFERLLYNVRRTKHQSHPAIL